MARKVTIWLRCDGCGTERQGRLGEEIWSLRDRLAAVGWASEPDDDVDLCGTCLVRQHTAALVQS